MGGPSHLLIAHDGESRTVSEQELHWQFRFTDQMHLQIIILSRRNALLRLGTTPDFFYSSVNVKGSTGKMSWKCQEDKEEKKRNV